MKIYMRIFEHLKIC